jgi:NAD/NADP transhydrogenase beta subunit
MYAETLTERDREARAIEVAAERKSLLAECTSALLNDPARVISAPGYGCGLAPAFDVLVDELAGIDSDAMRERLCWIVAGAARQTGDAMLQEAALRFLGDVCTSHAFARAGL